MENIIVRKDPFYIYCHSYVHHFFSSIGKQNYNQSDDMEEAERIKWIALSYKNLKKTSHAETDEFSFYRYENLERERDFCVDLDDFEDVPPFEPMEADDASPTVWYPRCPSVTTESAPLYNSVWKHLIVTTKARDTIGILLNSSDLDVITTIVHNLRLYIEESEGNYNIITEMNLLKDLLPILITKSDVKLRFMTTTLIESLLPVPSILEQLFLLHAIEALWTVFTEESDVTLLTHVARCMRYFADFETDLEYLVQQGACYKLYDHLDMPSKLLKSHLYDILIKLAINNDNNSKELADMSPSTFQEIMKDIRSYGRPYCRAIQFIDILLKLGMSCALETNFIESDGLELMLDIIKKPDLSECHQYAFNILGKLLSSPHAVISFDPRDVLKQLFLYVDGKIKSVNFEAFLKALTDIAKGRPSYQMKMMKLGIMQILSNVMSKDQTDDLLMAAINCATEMLETQDGLHTFFYYSLLHPVCEVLVNKKRSKGLQVAAALCLAEIASASYNRRKELLQHVEDKLHAILDPTNPAVVLREFMRCFTNCTLDEFSVMKIEHLKILLKKLVVLVVGETVPAPDLILLAVRAVNSLLFNSGLMVQPQDETSHHLVIGLLGHLMNEDSGMQLLDAVLETFNLLFNKDVEYVRRCLHTNLLEWLLLHVDMRSKLTFANPAMYTLISSDPSIKFALVGELNYMDKIPDGFLVSVRWHHDPESVKQANMIRTLPKGFDYPHYFINRNGFTNERDSHKLIDPKYLESTFIYGTGGSFTSVGEELKMDGLLDSATVHEKNTTIHSDPSNLNKAGTISRFEQSKTLFDLEVSRLFSYFKIICPEKIAVTVEKAKKMLMTPDHALNTIVNLVNRAISRGEFTKEEKLIIIAKEVDKAMGMKKHPGCTGCMVDMTQALMELTGINLIPLGLAHVGYKLERSLLFKLICDSLDIPCRLVRTKMINAWNEVMADRGKKFVVDLVDQVGRLIPVESREAAEYIREPGDKCTIHRDGPRLTIGEPYLPQYIQVPQFDLNLEECESELKIHRGLCKKDLLMPTEYLMDEGGRSEEDLKTLETLVEKTTTGQETPSLPRSSDDEAQTISMNEELAKPILDRILTKMDSFYHQRDSGGTLPVTASGSVVASATDLGSLVNMRYY